MLEYVDGQNFSVTSDHQIHLIIQSLLSIDVDASTSAASERRRRTMLVQHTKACQHGSIHAEKRADRQHAT